MSHWIRRIATALLVAMLAVGPALASAPGAGLVPLRLMAEAAGALVEWDGDTQTVTVTTTDGVTATLRIGEASAVLAGQPVQTGRPAELVNDRTMVTQEFLNALLGMPVHYDAVHDSALVDGKMATARAFVKALPEGKAAEMRDSFSPALKAAVPVELLSALAQSLEPFGAAGRPIVSGMSSNGVHQNVEVIVPFERAPLKVMVRFTPEGQIDDWFMAPHIPAQTADSPAYADLSAFTEEEVVVGQAPWALPGTLTLPMGEGPFPVVVLVHGSGPNDRDETIGGVKVFRDLAHGLAAKGIATLRYDKRTLEHSAKFSAIPGFTLQQETVEDALAAVRLVSKESRLNPEQIYVLGHSLGGMALPRILQQGSDRLIRGGIAMAAPNSLLDALLQQNKYLAQNGEVPPQQVPFMEGQIGLLRDPAFNPDQPPAGFMLGTPHYWVDLAPKVADLIKQQTQPLLFLQGSGTSRCRPLNWRASRPISPVGLT